MEKSEITNALKLLNDMLGEQQTKGEVCLYGGAAMCLAFDARPSTKDVDAVFHPASVIRGLSVKVAEKLNLPADWLTDRVKGFLVEHPRLIWLSLSHLTIYMAEPEYLFAMKAMAARVDTSDRADTQLLIGKLGIESLDQAVTLVEKYFPKKLIKPATMFFLEELFDENA